jgi:uncharacterized membrane protein YvbJ
MTDCPKCHAVNSADSVFCKQCGAALDDRVTIERQAVAPPPVVKTGPSRVIVTDIDMPFGSMMNFMLKWFFASIPVLIMIGIAMALAGGMFAACVSTLGRTVAR